MAKKHDKSFCKFFLEQFKECLHWPKVSIPIRFWVRQKHRQATHKIMNIVAYTLSTKMYYKILINNKSQEHFPLNSTIQIISPPLPQVRRGQLWYSCQITEAGSWPRRGSGQTLPSGGARHRLGHPAEPGVLCQAKLRVNRFFFNLFFWEIRDNLIYLFFLYWDLILCLFFEISWIICIMDFCVRFFYDKRW